MSNHETFREQMQPWPEMEEHGKQLILDDEGFDIFFFEAGEKNQPTILMIHGLGDEADTWRHVFTSFAEDYHVIAMDLPGFGRSDKPNIKYTPRFMMNAIINLMDKVNVRKSIMMGSSLGGILSHSLALAYPQRVMGLILVGGALLQQKSMGDWRLRLMQIPLLGEWFYTKLRKDPDAAYESLRNVYHALDTMPKPDRDFLYTRVNKRVWSDGQRRAYFSTLRNLSPWVRKLQSSLPERLTQLKIPTLVVRGEYDPLFPVENANRLMKVQPQAELRTVISAGHLPHQETPKLFLDAVMPWLHNTYQ